MHSNSALSRRRFLQSTTAVALTAPLLRAQEQGIPVSETLRVGLVGCGGRGTGAAAQALAADPNVKLVALADAFEDRLEGSLETLKKQEKIAGKLDVAPSHRFVGLDAYQRLIDSSVDVVLLATPPHFRPIHLRAAIAANKHVFAEKPVAVDAAGVRSVLASCEEAQRKKLAVVSGLALRYSYGHREIVRRIHQGAIGRVRTLQANDFRGPIWVKPNHAVHLRKTAGPAWSPGQNSAHERHLTERIF